VLARKVDLNGARRLLDVGGGSGAFSITFCRRFPELRATILDFPSVQTAAAAFVRAAGLSERIDFVPGNALTTDWPAVRTSSCFPTCSARSPRLGSTTSWRVRSRR
jgi:ubiquinone/menaquinone biosynthesis C-methylase UbiE